VATGRIPTRNDDEIKAIFFDFGGVLLKTFDGVDHTGIEERFGLEAKSLRLMVYRDSRYTEFQVGGCTYEEWVTSIRAAMDAQVPDRAADVLQAYLESDHELNPEMVGLVRRLHGTYTLGIISNTIPGMEERLRERIPDLIGLFDVRIGSGDVGMAKPDPAIFHQAAKLAGVAPPQCVFTDDYAKHADAAREVGMQAFHFTGYDQFVQDLQSIGVLA
jgi:epoxide hydrolase-like predicted phosphatase